jgi:hypothetical protein
MLTTESAPSGRPTAVVAVSESGLLVAVLLAVSAMLTGSRAVADILYPAPFLSFRSVYTTTSLALGDLNGDGRLDVAATHDTCSLDWLGSHLEVRLGTGDGTFGMPTTPYSGGHFTSVAIGDLNGDGKLDLAATDRNTVDYTDGDKVLVKLGNGNGTFAPVQRYGTGLNPLSVVICDFNSDGKPDLAIANHSDNTVSVLLGIGDGTYGTKQDFGAGSGPVHVATGDFNGDGKPDLTVANADGNSVSVLLGNGDGTFGAKHDFSTGAHPTHVAIERFDTDGNLDLAVVNGDDSTVSVLLGNGDGTFETRHDYGTGSFPTSVAAGDLTGDGPPDLVVTRAGTLSVLPGNGDGTFGAKNDFMMDGGTSYSVAIGDLNLDGIPDVAAACGNAVSVLLGNGDGTFGTENDQQAVSGPTSVAAGDFNGDGRPDLAVANEVDKAVSVLLGNGDGTFGAKQDFGVGDFPISLAVGDFNTDGNPDLVAANYMDYTVSVLLGNGNGTFGTKLDFETGICPYSVAIADFNRDGSPDLAVANYWNGGVSVLLGNGDGTFGTRQDRLTGNNPTCVAAGDLNEDGKPDMVVTNVDQPFQPGSVSVLLGNGDGTFGTKHDYGYFSGPVSVAIGGDLNGDGQSKDLAVTYLWNPACHTWWNRGDGTFGPDDYCTIPGSALSIAIGDLDGDGKPDLAMTANASNTVAVYSCPLASTVSPGIEYGTGLDPESVAIADFNSDGRLDLAVANRYGNTVSVLINLLPGLAGAPPSAPTGEPIITEILPNPARGHVTLRFAMPRPGGVQLGIYDVAGRLVYRVLDQCLAPGVYSFPWDGRDGTGLPTPAGVYLYQLRVDGQQMGRRLVLLR